MSKRIEQIAHHLRSEEEERSNVLYSNQTASSSASDDDVVIVSAVRTPIARAHKGSFKDTPPEDLLTAAIKAVVEKVKLDPKHVQDIQVGNVLPPGGGAGVARMASFYAGFPVETSVMTVNRQCSSGLQACANIVAAIKAGFIEVGIGAGVESMTLGWGPTAQPTTISEKINDVKLAADCLLPMGITSENVAERYGVSRDKQDAFSALSHAKAAKAQELQLFEEIIPVKVKVKDDKGNEKEIVVSQDEGIRKETTADRLAKLQPAFKKGGSTTAGNSSQVSDGAAAVLMMKRSTAKKLNMPILGKFLSFAVVGVPPDVMGIGPAFAIPKALEQAGITKDQVDVFEINEAFASQALYSCEKLGLDMSKVNPLGGAIALGHPLGCTGARQIATILPQLKRNNGKYGVISMCIGTGMGAAAVIQKE